VSLGAWMGTYDSLTETLHLRRRKHPSWWDDWRRPTRPFAGQSPQCSRLFAGQRTAKESHADRTGGWTLGDGRFVLSNPGLCIRTLRRGGLSGSEVSSWRQREKQSGKLDGAPKGQSWRSQVRSDADCFGRWSGDCSEQNRVNGARERIGLGAVGDERIGRGMAGLGSWIGLVADDAQELERGSEDPSRSWSGELSLWAMPIEAPLWCFRY